MGVRFDCSPGLGSSFFGLVSRVFFSFFFFSFKKVFLKILPSVQY